MSQFVLRLPDSLAESIKRLAEENRVSMNMYVMVTLAEKVSAVDTARFFAERRTRANPALAAKIWAKVPDGAPLPGDELPHDLRAKTNARVRAEIATLATQAPGQGRQEGARIELNAMKTGDRPRFPLRPLEPESREGCPKKHVDIGSQTGR